MNKQLAAFKTAGKEIRRVGYSYTVHVVYVEGFHKSQKLCLAMLTKNFKI